jgi:nitroreductase
MKSIVKKFVPSAIYQFTRSAARSMVIFVISVASRSRFLSSFYYLISSEFSSEHKAVLNGRMAYYDSLRKIGKSCALLRRNIHRLEKGLIMQPRRKVFAEGFILETANYYKKALIDGRLDEGEKRWASDVLEEYFAVVGDSPLIEQARHIYTETKSHCSQHIAIATLISTELEVYKPYLHLKLPETSIDFKTLHSLFVRRRSVRWYQNKAVSADTVLRAVNIAALAPSACNRQPYRFLFCNDKKKTVDIAKCAGGTVGFSENLMAILVIVGDLSAYPLERDRHLIYIDSSLVAMQLMLALETLGLSTCSINWPDIDSSDAALRRIVEIRGYERVVMLLAVGYADEKGGIPYSQKKVNEMIFEDISG